MREKAKLNSTGPVRNGYPGVYPARSTTLSKPHIQPPKQKGLYIILLQLPTGDILYAHNKGMYFRV